MKRILREIWQFLAIMLISIAASIGYGLVRDQITIRFCPQYFTIFHERLIDSKVFL